MNHSQLLKSGNMQTPILSKGGAFRLHDLLAVGLKLKSRFNYRKISAADSVTATDGFIIIDTAAGNVVLSVDPSVIGVTGFSVKKKGSDTNSVTILMTTGKIYADAGAQSSYTFFGPGAAVILKSDATDLYLV